MSFWDSLCEFIEGFNEAGATTLAPPTFTGPAYEPMLKIEAGGEKEYIGMTTAIDPESMKTFTVQMLRKMMDGWTEGMNIPKYAQWNKQASFVRKSLGGRRYHPDAKRTYAYLHTKNGEADA